MLKVIAICDICIEDGYDRIAVAEYVADDKESYHACKKHFKFVKEANLKYKLLEADEEGCLFFVSRRRHKMPHVMPYCYGEFLCLDDCVCSCFYWEDCMDENDRREGREG